MFGFPNLGYCIFGMGHGFSPKNVRMVRIESEESSDIRNGPNQSIFYPKISKPLRIEQIKSLNIRQTTRTLPSVTSPLQKRLLGVIHSPVIVPVT